MKPLSLKIKWWILLTGYILVFGFAGVAVNILNVVYNEDIDNLSISVCTHWNETCLSLCEQANLDPTKNMKCPNCCEAYIDKPITLNEKIKDETSVYFIIFGFIGFLIFGLTHNVRKYFPDGNYR